MGFKLSSLLSCFWRKKNEEQEPLHMPLTPTKQTLLPITHRDIFHPEQSEGASSQRYETINVLLPIGSSSPKPCRYEYLSRKDPIDPTDLSKRIPLDRGIPPLRRTIPSVPSPSSGSATRVYDVAVMGAGPGGLMTAIAAAHRGVSVCLVEPRSSYDRGQRVVVGDDTRVFLNNLACNLLEKFGPDAMFQVDPNHPGKQKYVRDFLVESMSKMESLSLKDIEGFLTHYISHANLDITVVPGAPKTIDVKSETFVVGSEDTPRTYRQLVFSDGSRRQCAQLAHEGAGDAYAYSPKKTEKKDPGLYVSQVAAMQLEIPIDRAPLGKSRFDQPRFGSDAVSQEFLQKLKTEFGWKKDSLPFGFAVPHENPRKVYMNMEVPESIAARSDPIEQKNALERFAQVLLAHMTREDSNPHVTDDFRVRSRVEVGTEATDRQKRKAKLDVQTWAMELSALPVEQAIQKVEGSHVVSIGDAFQSAFFPFGHGANDAMSSAIAYAAGLTKDHASGRVEYDPKSLMQTMESERRNLNYGMERGWASYEIREGFYG